MPRSSGTGNALRSLKAFSLIAAALFFVPLAPVFADTSAASPAQVNLTVTGCNNNGICEAGIGETAGNCPIDCTVTPPPPPPPAPSASGGLVLVPAIVTNVLVRQHETSVDISWLTAAPTISNFAWGRTTDYQAGVLSEASYSYTHTITLTGLSPHTQYFFSIMPQLTSGFVLATYQSSFTTLSVSLPDYPSNPRAFAAAPSGTGIALRWSNPPDSDSEDYRIIRSTIFYPADPQNGKIIYEGKGNDFFDADAEDGTLYYYAIFARNDSGIFSSGAVARTYRLAPLLGRSAGSEGQGETAAPLPEEPAAGNPFLEKGNPLWTPNLSGIEPEIRFFQFESEIASSTGSLGPSYQAVAGWPIALRLTVPSAVTDSISNALIFIKDSSSRTYDFILKAGQKAGDYETEIPELPPGESYQYIISLYEQIPSGHRDFSGMISARIEPFGVSPGWQASTGGISTFWILIIPLILLLLLWHIYRRWRKRQEEKKSKLSP